VEKDRGQTLRVLFSPIIDDWRSAKKVESLHRKFIPTRNIISKLGSAIKKAIYFTHSHSTSTTIMPASRRGSGTLMLPSGHIMTIHTRTQDEEDLPHATKKYVFCHFRATITDIPQDDGRSPSQAREPVCLDLFYFIVCLT